MKLKIFLLTVILCLQILVTSAANIPLMPVQDIVPGMHGVAKTVVVGDEIEEFYVEVIGVSGTETSGYSILVRSYGDLVERTGGIAQGMSGSPVYIDGRLVGAVAYGKSFNDPHYCFLTPIGDMLKMLDTPQKQKIDWIPKGTSLMAGGFSDAGFAVLKEELGKQGLEVMRGVQGSQSSSKPFEPGSAVGVSLMTGDMTIGALGTVTWTDDDGHILAFGHPFMSRGDSSFFMNKAWMLGAIPNLNSSYKVGNIGEAVGSIVQDRSSGIAGEVAKLPKSIPVAIQVKDLSRGVRKSARVRVIDDEKLLPAVINSAAISTVTAAADRSLGGTAKVGFRITGVDTEKKFIELKHENMFYTNKNFEKVIMEELLEGMNIIVNNKFEKINLYNVDVDVEVSDEVQVAELTKVSCERKSFKPGDKARLKLQLRPFRGKEFTQFVEFEIPKKHHGGKLVLNIHGGANSSWVVNQLRKQKESDSQEAKKTRKNKFLADFVKEFNETDCNNSLIIDITGGMSGLPKNDGDPATMLKGSPYKKVVPYDFIIDGEIELVLNVERQ